MQSSDKSMKMIDKYWFNNKESDQIVLIGNNSIYKGNPKPEKIHEFKRTIEKGVIPENLFGIPFSYINRIELRQGETYIEVFFSEESTERIELKNQKTREEVFNYFKANIPEAKYKLEEYSSLQSAKKPLIAILVIIAIYSWSLTTAILLGKGELYGQQLVIILALAGLGVFRLTLLFGGLFLIALFSAIRKMRNPPIIHTLKFR